MSFKKNQMSMSNKIVYSKKIKLMESQRELLRLKRLIVQDAIQLAEQKQAELQRAIETVALELGIDLKKERWRLSDDFSFFERMEVKDESKGKEKRLDKLETMEGLIASINQLLTLSEWEIKEAIKKFLKEEKQ